MDLPDARGDDVLAQPTRARLFALLRDLGRPATSKELASLLGLHVNGVRAHLARLSSAGLVHRRRANQPRGRPRDEWAIASRAEPGGSAPRAYRDLARWLARAIPARPSRLDEVETVGSQVGRGLAPSSRTDPEEALRGVLAGLGFQPEMTRKRSGALSCRLGNCPYRDSVKENQEVVCALHRGVTRGLLAALDPDAALVKFVPKDPDRAGCLIEVEGLEAA